VERRSRADLAGRRWEDQPTRVKGELQRRWDRGGAKHALNSLGIGGEHVTYFEAPPSPPPATAAGGGGVVVVVAACGG
jgi:hypothetical protein